MHRIAAGVVLALLALALAAPGDALAKSCGSVQVDGAEYPVNVSKSSASCKTVRKVAKNAVKGGPMKTVRTGGWRCFAFQCTKGKGVIQIELPRPGGGAITNGSSRPLSGA